MLKKKKTKWKAHFWPDWAPFRSVNRRFFHLKLLFGHSERPAVITTEYPHHEILNFSLTQKPFQFCFLPEYEVSAVGQKYDFQDLQ